VVREGLRPAPGRSAPPCLGATPRERPGHRGGRRRRTAPPAAARDAPTPPRPRSRRSRSAPPPCTGQARTAGWCAPASLEAFAPGMRHNGTEEADRPGELRF
jgi:hypothetical protein